VVFSFLVEPLSLCGKFSGNPSFFSKSLSFFSR
jgi:hypothetical protein